MREVKVWGGFGEKKSNSNTQWYIQDRVYDSDGLCPALTSFKADYWIILKKDDNMNRLITLTGAKNSPKDKIALEFDKNENVGYVPPYTDNQNADPWIFRVESKDLLSSKIQDPVENLLQLTEINGHRYAHFESQLKNDYNVIIVDDIGVQEVKENFDGKLVTVRVLGGEPSDRVGMLGIEWFDYQIIEDTDLDYLIEEIAGEMMEI